MFQFFFDTFYLSLGGSGGKDVHAFQNRSHAGGREGNALMACEELCKVLEGGIKVFSAVEVDDGAADFIRGGGSRLAASVAVNKERFAVCLIAGQHAVNVPPGAAKSHGSTVFVAVGMFCQVFNYFVLFLFVHCKINLSDNVYLLTVYVWRIFYHIRDIFICGISGHYHKWLIKELEKVKKQLDKPCQS